MEDNGILMASEPAVAAYPTTSYVDVMRYLHTNLSRVFARLDDLASLKENWDGEGGLPVSRRVLDNVKNTLLISDDEDWQEWLLGADANATIGLQSKLTKACISLGAREFSYYARKNGERLGESHIDFTPEALLNTMRKIG